MGTSKAWFEPGNPGDESPVKGTMRLILGGRFILHEYKGSMERADDNVNLVGSYLYVTPEKEHVWGWRTTIELLSGDALKIIAYNISLMEKGKKRWLRKPCIKE